MKGDGVRQLELLLTDHCTLCEKALDVIFSAPIGGWQLVSRDIAMDDELLDEFAERIPVLRVGKATLDWPFDVPALLGWLESLQTE